MDGTSSDAPSDPAAECSAMSRYLVGLPADERLQREYAAFLRIRGRTPRGVFDRMCLALMGRGPIGVALVDAYVSRLQRGGPAFQRLVGMLALLECLPESSARLDRPDTGGAVLIVVRLTGRLLLDLFALACSLVLLGPVHLLQRLTAPREERA